MSSSNADRDKAGEDQKAIMKAWYNQFAQKQTTGFKVNNAQFIEEQKGLQSMTNKLGQAMGIALISKFLELGPDAASELKKIDQYDFNIFRLRDLTNGNELETVLPFILTKHNLIAGNKLEFNYLINFVRALARGYKQITYHN